MSRLQEKTPGATAEPFVFFQLKNDNSGAQFDGDDYSVFETAVRTKNQGNDEFKTGDFKKAIEAYDDAITLLQTLDTEKCGRELAICYQNRAAANEKLGNIPMIIVDATKAIEADKTYAKGYFRRARGYIIEKRFYSAMQNAVWACIFDRYRTEEYNKMAANLNSRFELISIKENADAAEKEMNYMERQYDIRNRICLKLLIKSTLLDDILMPIGDNATADGYLRAMRGLNELKLFEIRAGCTAEIASKGHHWIEARILLAYVNTFGSLFCENQKELVELHLILSGTTTQNLNDNIALCLGNILMEIFRREVDTEQFAKARKTYKLMREILGELAQTYRHDHKIYLIRSGVLQDLTLATTDNVMMCSNGQWLTDFEKCCELMPNFYYPHWQREMMNAKRNLSRSPLSVFKRLRILHERFPDEAEIQAGLNATLCATGQHEKAEHELNKFRIRCPEKVWETWHIEAMMHLGQPRMVECFKQCITYQPYSAEPYYYLISYFEKETHEYGKCLEVANKLLDHAVNPSEFADAFVCRQDLLSKIIKENYWEKL